jgi:hypothetical protein
MLQQQWQQQQQQRTQQQKLVSKTRWQSHGCDSNFDGMTYDAI